ncbi:hypothetical protein COO60DRAFT_109209 [Scenedesmus sp. NREL 46B-D3]|nr:hypothetical protein COO60DRAFT_109209 [Scenedesmus sp. NREL 46B-D3]
MGGTGLLVRAWYCCVFMRLAAATVLAARVPMEFCYTVRGKSQCSFAALLCSHDCGTPLRAEHGVQLPRPLALGRPCPNA